MQQLTQIAGLYNGCEIKFRLLDLILEHTHTTRHLYIWQQLYS